MTIKQKICRAIVYCSIQNKPLLYISGKVSDLPADEVRSKFTGAEKHYSEMGFAIFNPTKWLSPDEDWQEAMKLCTAVLPMCDNVVLLHDWADSKGAIAERGQALLLGIPTIENYEPF
jgi:hypothetical protein